MRHYAGRIAVLCVCFFSVTSFCGELKFIHINIGQGDSTLILGPEDSSGKRVSVLMDAGDIPNGGKRDGGAIVLATLQKYGVSKLDYFIASHYDADHIGGAITGKLNVHGHSFILGTNNVPGAIGDDNNDGKADWLDNAMIKPDPNELGKDDDIRIGTFVDRGDENAGTSVTYKKYVAMASSMGARECIVSQSKVDSFEINLGGGAKMICLAANGYVKGRTTRVANVDTENERSLCFLVDYEKFQYIIGGDTIGRQYGNENAQVEAAIGQYIQANNINVDVLHVNHHGANNASDSAFLAAIAPEVAIISAGNGNPHHHPHKDALKRLAEADVLGIYQTEWGTTEEITPPEVRQRQAIFQGDVILTTNGKTYQISTVKDFNVDE